MRYAAPALVLLLALVPTRPAAAQSAALVASMLEPVDAVMADDGSARLLAEPLSGGLEAGASDRIAVPLSLPPGTAFRIVGVCDADCDDLDLTLYDGSGAEIDTDIALDATPIVEGRATGSGFELSVGMVSCSVEPCYWAVMVYVAEADLQARAGATGAGAGASGAARRESGRLASGDRTLGGGEYFDEYTVSGRSGSSLVVELSSEDFDTYLFVVAPDGTQQDNDDFEGDVRRSVVAWDLEQEGDYRVVVTSFSEGEEGAYDLVIESGAAADAAARTERGTLAAGDATLGSGEYLDEYTFEGRPGQRVRVDLESSDFDTYVMLVGPEELREENDDFEGSTGHSAIEVDLTERGTYRVIVTSYAPGEGGSYSLQIGTSDATASLGQRDVERLEPGVRATGSLQEGDATIETGEYRDLWSFEGTAGQSVVVEMTSSGFDSWLGLLGPDGTVIDQNDDADGRTDLSRVEVTLGESGRYRVVATSYAAGETGTYSLDLRAGAASASTGLAAGGGRAAGAQIYGIFAGISDYGGRASNLAYTAEDAVNFADALVEGAGLERDNAVVLTDAQATVANVEAAFEEIGRRMGPEDTFVFFYSGHGSRVPRAAGPDRLDPDGLDETLSLYDADITDDRMHELMTLVDGGTSVLILDACFSGGFSKDVISMPGRIGFFSSEEDVTSQVAAKFRAGGYLSIFAADAVGGGYADADGDGAINAIELSQYLHERYRADVKSADPSEYVRTGGPQSGFQHLVVDRGSIGPYDVVFPRR